MRLIKNNSEIIVEVKKIAVFLSLFVMLIDIFLLNLFTLIFMYVR